MKVRNWLVMLVAFALLMPLLVGCMNCVIGDVYAFKSPIAPGMDGGNMAVDSQGIVNDQSEAVAQLPAEDVAVSDKGKTLGRIALTFGDIVKTQEIDATTAIDLAKRLKNSNTGEGENTVDDKDSVKIPLSVGVGGSNPNANANTPDTPEENPTPANP
jgi:hypothetical protein